MTTPRPINLPPPRIIKVGEEPPPMTTARPTPSASSRREPKGPAKQGKAAASSRFNVLNTLVDATLAHLSRNEIACWLVLFRDTHGRDASTGLADLARRAGCSRRTAIRTLQRLQAAGLVRRLKRGSASAGVSRYRVRGELLPELRARLDAE